MILMGALHVVRHTYVKRTIASCFYILIDDAVPKDLSCFYSTWCSVPITVIGHFSDQWHGYGMPNCTVIGVICQCNNERR